MLDKRNDIGYNKTHVANDELRQITSRKQPKDLENKTTKLVSENP